LLLGFSKSGWGALSLVFNYPDFFGYAASWDAPLLWDDAGFGQINTDAAYGTLESYRRQHPVESAKRSAAAFRDRARVVVLGRQYWGDHNRRYHELLDELQIKHVFRDDLGPPHEWNVGWLGPAVAELAALTESA
jgi:S-formylglutathione hydrolase FrmB